MSGPIVRSGPTSQFSENWDKIFGGEGSSSRRKAKKPAAKTMAVKKAAAKPMPKKPALKKKAGKKSR